MIFHRNWACSQWDSCINMIRLYFHIHRCSCENLKNIHWYLMVLIMRSSLSDMFSNWVHCTVLPSHWNPSLFSVYPLSQLHLYDPAEFVQSWSHVSVCSEHSSISTQHTESDWCTVNYDCIILLLTRACDCIRVNGVSRVAVTMKCPRIIHTDLRADQGTISAISTLIYIYNMNDTQIA